MNIAIQLGLAILSIHNQGIIHRDLKAVNVLIRITPDGYELYIIDFGLCERVINSRGVHIKSTNKSCAAGTYYYMSIEAMDGAQQSMKSDWFSYCCILMSLVMDLPWKGASIENMRKMKLDLLKNKPWRGKLNESFDKLFTYVFGMGFEEQPDSAHILKMLIELENPITRFQFALIDPATADYLYEFSRNLMEQFAQH